MGTKEYWVSELEKLSYQTLQNPSLANRKILSTWYTRRISFEGDVSEIECIREIDSRKSALEITIALSISGAKEFSEFLWERQIAFKKQLLSISGNRQLDLGNIDRFVAFHALQEKSYTDLEILNVLANLPMSEVEEFELLLKTSVEETLIDPENLNSELVKIIIPYLDNTSNPELLLVSCKYRKIGNWLERLKFAYEKLPERFDNLSNLASELQTNSAFLSSAVIQTKALTGDPEALKLFLHIGQYLRSDSSQVSKALPNELSYVTTHSFHNGGYTEEAFKTILDTQPNEVPGSLISAAKKYKQNDPKLFRTVTDYLIVNKLWQQFIDKMEEKALDKLSESDFDSLLLASKTTNNFELTVKLHAHKEISDNSLLGRCAAELINIGKVKEGIVLYNEVKDLDPTGSFKLPISRLFLSKLNGHGLINYDKIEKIENPFYLEKIAKHLVSSLAPLSDINHYLVRAIELKDASAASLFVEINIDSNIDRQVLELAASSTSDFIAKRELAKILIREDRREEALELALVAAENDDQAAHLLIYVLNENVAEWAYKLYERDSEYSPEVYRRQFLSQGITLTPRYSALDNLELHRLVREGAPKQSRVSKASQSRVEESWFCREAIGKYQGSGSWQTLSCKNHRERTCEFHAEKMFPEVDDISWAISTEAIISQSSVLSIEDKPNLAKLLGRREPRAWQKEAFNAWVSHGRHGIVEAATGSGKSMLGVMAALEAMDEGYAVVIVVPTRVLQQQWIKQYFLTLWDAPGAKIRTIGNMDGDYVRDVAQLSPGTITVAVAKSLRENPSLNPAEGVKSLIIADEVHNYTSEASQKMLSSNYSRRLGLTATLEPPQGRYPVLANYFGGDPIYRYDFTRAVKEKVISPYNLVTIGVPLEKEIARLYTAAYVRMKNAKDQLLMLGNIVNNPDSLNRTIEIFHSKGLHTALIKEYESAFEESDNYLKDANSKAGAIRLVTDFIKARGNTIVFSDLVATARNIQIIFKERGLDSEVISAEVPQSERETIFRKLKNKTISALLSPKALDEGVDIEQLSTGVFAGASRRRLQIIQRLGRVLRISENKQMPLLILIVADGTEEDPCMPNNESMQNSPFGIVYDQAVSKKHFKLEDDTEIRRYLLGLAKDLGRVEH